MPPAFDPVRDAVLNSPSQPSVILKSPGFPRLDISSSLPLTSATTRRATDLSVLLNSNPLEPSPPATSRRWSSGLSHLLHDDSGDDKLTSFEPLRRPQRQQSEPSRDPEQEPSFQPRRTYTVDSSAAVSRKLPPAQIQPSFNSSTLGPGPSSTQQTSTLMLLSPDFSTASRPSSSSTLSTQQNNTTPQATSSPNMPPPKPLVPYNPTKRITPADSVLVPMSPMEMEMYKNYCGQGTQRLMKRKRARSSEPAEDLPPLKKMAGDVGVVVDHYNARPEVGVAQRLDSPIIGLKNFNNWVKSVLIAKFAHPALAASPPSRTNPTRGKQRFSGKVLDLGCGKGGDLSKWGKANIREYVGVDIAAVSVDQARDRWEQLRAPRFEASFAALDCYSNSLAKAFSPAKLSQLFDVVSMQFCMHYAFENVQKARCMLYNVSQWLRPGGTFIGTIPNAEQLLRRLDSIPPGQEELSYGNSVYKIRFEERKQKPVFGHKYWFFLKDAVEDVPEYVVRWDNFVQMAEEYKLVVKYKEEFHQVFEEFKEDKEFGPLMVRMKVVDENGESSMDEDQWEAANIYIAFAFEKLA